MLSKSLVSLVCAVTLLACLGATPAVAQTLDKEVHFTFSGPVAMPGVTLPAGSYLFRIVNPTSAGNVVQVTSADRKHHYGFFMMNRDWVPVIPEKPEVRFVETRINAPQAIRAWFYPGERLGYSFVYPTQQEKNLSARATAN